ncbi:hypothetical protein [Pseudomonas sp. PGPR40]|uniref:hypothetical protein n=1 Tax=Pseudomonas sp. PGPR40 TaxID=2913476 RepID=UPI001EDA8BBD|nr:hypothetical protein [Pseudomonas sp. PGPR40]
MTKLGSEHISLYPEFSHYNTPYDKGFDSMQSGMLDGRTIHFHFQFVEPVLGCLYPEARETKDKLRMGSLDLISLATRDEYTSVKCTKKVKGPFNTNFLVDSLLSSKQGRSRVGRALSYLDDLGLVYLPVMSIGAVALNLRKDVNYVASLDLEARTVDEDAMQILLAAAGNIAHMWMRSEDAARARCFDEGSDIVQLTKKHYSSLMSQELKSRAGVPFEVMSLNDSESIAASLESYPLTRHLIMYWNRCWNRQAFLSGSAFDHAPTLQELYK